MVGFNYVIELVPDKKYGALDPETGEWNGIVRQILEKVFTNSKNAHNFDDFLNVICRKPIWLWVQ